MCHQAAGVQDLKKKEKLREKFAVSDDWVLPFEVVPIIDIPGFGDKAAVKACLLCPVPRMRHWMPTFYCLCALRCFPADSGLTARAGIQGSGYRRCLCGAQCLAALYFDLYGCMEGWVEAGGSMLDARTPQRVCRCVRI